MIWLLSKTSPDSKRPCGAGPYDGYIDLSPHSNVFLLLQEIVPGDQ